MIPGTELALRPRADLAPYDPPTAVALALDALTANRTTRQTYAYLREIRCVGHPHDPYSCVLHTYLRDVAGIREVYAVGTTHVTVQIGPASYMQVALPQAAIDLRTDFDHGRLRGLRRRGGAR